MRARVNSEKGQKYTLFQTAIALQNARLPPFSFKYSIQKIVQKETLRIKIKIKINRITIGDM